jgi:prephenate dehydratase
MIKSTVIGIQGGRGSFNEAAILWYMNENNLRRCRVQHLYTTAGVLEALRDKRIDNGQFAIYNSLGGVVEESLQAMEGHTFKIIARYRLKVSHSLMIHKDARRERIDTVMTHPQVLKQCRKQLAARYPHLKLRTGEGEAIDPARVSELLSSGSLPKTVATLGNRALAEVYGLRIIDNDLQDNDNNETTFLLVSSS